MTTSDIGEIIYDKCRPYGIDTIIKGNIPYREIDAERIVIGVGDIHDGRYWNESIVSVSWCVLDKDNEEDGIRTKQVNKLMKSLYYGIGDFEGTYYRFKKSTIGVAKDTDMRCHIVRLTLKFQIQNIK